MKRTICFLMCLMIFAGVMITAQAAGERIILGDADLDGIISILDATRIQRTVAELYMPGDDAALAADVDTDESITILDATRVQRYLVEMCNIDGSVPYDRDHPAVYVSLSEPPAEDAADDPAEPVTEAPTQPPKPMLATPKITRVAADNTGAIVYWGKVAGAEKYRLFIKNGSSWKRVGDTVSDQLTFTGAKEDTVYTYTVRCINAAGNEFTSDYDKTGFTARMLRKPVINSIMRAGNTITVNWGKVNGAVKYRLFHKVNGEWRRLADTTAPSYTYEHEDKNVVEYYTVRCVDATGLYFTSGYDVNGREYEFSQSVTNGMRKALESARVYLRISPYSYQGLKDKLKTDKYTDEEINYAVNNCGANWNEQAIKKAKAYLKTDSYSYIALVDRLSSDRFTDSQAKYGVEHSGANWFEQAVLKGQSYLNYGTYTYEELVSQIESDGFTHDQAVYGAQQNGLVP